MRTIGLLGGMSWESTTEYYRLVNHLVRERRGHLHSARCLLYSIDFADIEPLQVAGDWDAAGDLLARAARALENGGADMVVLCTNTMHRVADQVQAAVRIPLLHIVDITAAAVRAQGLRRVGLLGTRYTMEQPFYTDRMAAQDVATITPDADGRTAVHDIIFDELCQGIMLPRSRERVRTIMGQLADAGAEGVILGCTELELLVGEEDSPVPLFASTKLHAAAAVEHALTPEVGAFTPSSPRAGDT